MKYVAESLVIGKLDCSATLNHREDERESRRFSSLHCTVFCYCPYRYDTDVDSLKTDKYKK